MPQGDGLGVKAGMPSAFSGGAMARKPLPDVFCYPRLDSFLTWGTELRLGHRILRLEASGVHSESGGTFKKSELLNLEKRQCAGAKNPVFRDVKRVLWVKGLTISFVLGDTKG